MKKFIKEQPLEVEKIGKNENLLRIDNNVMVFFDKQKNSLKYTNPNQKLKMREIKL
jgi:hypothetical protein